MNTQYLELCLLGTHISEYPTISHGKTRIPGVNDGEEFELVDVSDASQLVAADRFCSSRGCPNESQAIQIPFCKYRFLCCASSALRKNIKI